MTTVPREVARTTAQIVAMRPNDMRPEIAILRLSLIFTFQSTTTGRRVQIISVMTEYAVGMLENCDAKEEDGRDVLANLEVNRINPNSSVPAFARSFWNPVLLYRVTLCK